MLQLNGVIPSLSFDSSPRCVCVYV
uniref:Uncharacterized protein n=1 Tax=Anopheles albimanus TaxID=7167 RepID=A0A182FXP3_ANOAL